MGKKKAAAAESVEDDGVPPPVTDDAPAVAAETPTPPPSMDTLKGRARKAALAKGHRLGHFRREGTSGGSEREQYMMARCERCQLATAMVGPQRYPAPHYGGTAITDQCTAPAEDPTAPAAVEPTAVPQPAPPPAVEATEDDMKATSTKKAKATKKTPKADTGKRGARRVKGTGAKRGRYFLFPKEDSAGYSVLSVLRWMGAKGFTYEQATAALKSQGIEPAEQTMKISLRQTDAKKFAQAELTKDEAAKLLKFKK